MYEKELFYFFYFVSYGKVCVFEKNNIFAIVNIAKVSSYGDFNEFCFLFSR